MTHAKQHSQLVMQSKKVYCFVHRYVTCKASAPLGCVPQEQDTRNKGYQRMHSKQLAGDRAKGPLVTLKRTQPLRFTILCIGTRPVHPTLVLGNPRVHLLRTSCNPFAWVPKDARRYYFIALLIAMQSKRNLCELCTQLRPRARRIT